MDNHERWQNIKVDHYLDSIAAWIQDSKVKIDLDDRAWNFLAGILLWDLFMNSNKNCNRARLDAVFFVCVER